MLIVAAGLLLLAGGALWMAQDALLLFPPVDGAVGDRSVAGRRLEDPGQGFTGWVLEPASGEARATLVLMHGNAGCATGHAPLAERFAARGWRVVSLEYPGYCGRAGRARMDAILADAAERVAQWRGRWPVPMVVGGYSLGAGVAAAVAARDARVDGLLLITPWASFRGLAAHHYGWLPAARWIARGDLETIDLLEPAVRRGAGLVLVGAGRDAVIPVGEARAIAARYPRALYVELPDAGHDDWIGRLDDARWARIDAALDDTLRRSARQ